jgi:DNA-binding transcriptional MerR regulator
MEAKKAHGQPPAQAPPKDPEDRHFYKIGEVCDMTDTQPYVLRFWESEFPQLAPRKNRAGQRVYQKQDVEMVLRIKKLLYEEEYTIAGARKKLEDDGLVATQAPPVAATTRRGSPPVAPAKRGEASGTHERDLLMTLRELRKEIRGLKEILDKR